MLATLPRRAFLGAELPGDHEAFTVDGIWIAGVAPGTMAAEAGLAAGDQLRTVAGLPVRTLAELTLALRRAGASATTELVFARDGEVVARTVPVIAQPLEQIDGIAVDYGALDVDGARLRTITTHVAAPRSLVAFVQGIACESIDHALSPDAPLAGLVAGLARAGHDTLRFDKRGVGDSEGGPCPVTDFTTELGDARSVLVHARELAAARGVPLVLFGHSVGGIIAALLAPAVAPAGVVVYGTPVMRWIECLKDSTRRQLALRAADDDEISARVAALDELAERGELNGRSAAYHAQLDRVDIAAAWREVTAPVLVVRGEHDWVVDADDQARIASLAQGPTTILDIPSLDHLFGAHPDREASLRDYGVGEMSPALAVQTIGWLDRLRSTP